MVHYVISKKQVFDRYFSFWLLAICLPLLFFPKINLFDVAERESAGVRIDDVILLIFSFVFFWGYFMSKRSLFDVERSIYSLVGFSVFSFVINRLFVAFHLLHVDASIFYCLRILEYFMFFYIGFIAFQFFEMKLLIFGLFLWNSAIMVMQRGELLGQFSVSGYLSSASDRVTGVASFPSEAGLLISMMFCFLIYDEEMSGRWMKLSSSLLGRFIRKTYIYWLFIICVTLVVFTGSRIAIFALIIAFLFRVIANLKQMSLSSWLIALLFTGLAAAVIAITVVHTDSVFGRSAKLLSFRNVELISKVWDRIDLSHEPVGREIVRNQNYDTSWWIRIHKWCYALKVYYTHPESYLTGIGPGFAMAALDGGFLRILTEYGILGSLLFWQMFSAIYRKNKQLQWMVIVFAINMIFFDAYLAYKPMSLLFFVTGYFYASDSE